MDRDHAPAARALDHGNPALMPILCDSPMRLRFRLPVWLLLALAAPALGRAQSLGVPGIGENRGTVRLRDYAERRFASSDGLQSLAVFAVEVLRDGSLWIGTNEGPHRFTGGRFEQVPLIEEHQHVRAIAQTADGDVWFGTRVGVLRRSPDGRVVKYGVAEGVPAGTVYSLVLTDAFGDREEVVAATGGGVVRFDGSGWQPVALPPEIEPAGLVVTPRARPGARDELWLGNMRGAAARFRDGAWAHGPDVTGGLRVASLERFVVAQDSVRTLYATTNLGVFRFLESDNGTSGRWERLAGSPAYAYRLAVVPLRDGLQELWVGTLDGLLMRRRGSTWDTIALRSTEPRTPVHALTSAPGHAGGHAVYVGSFGDGLIRLSVGRAATLVSEASGLRFTIGSVLEAPLGQAGVVWLATSDFGVVEVNGDQVRTEIGREALIDGRALTLFSRQHRDGTHEAWIGAALGAWRREGTGWVRRIEGLGATAVVRFAAERSDDPESPLLAATDSGLRVWRGARWERVPGTPEASAHTVLGGTSSDPTVWVAGAYGTLARRDGAWTLDSTLRQSGLYGRVRTMCRLPASEGDRVLIAGEGAMLVRERTDARWRPLPEQIRQLLPSDNIYSIRCDEPARVQVATVSGLAVLDLRGADPARWRLVTTLGAPDGLPSPVILAIADGGVPGAHWIGTAQGVGRVDLPQLEEPAPSVFTMRVLGALGSDTVAEGARLPHDENLVTVRLVLPTFHREEDLRYRIELDGAPSSSSGAWQTASEVTFPALTPGDYTVRAWARDFTGREYGPIMHAFSVAYPPWRSPTTLGGLLLALLAVLTGAHRWRLRLLRDRAEELAASEQRARASEAQLRALFDRAHDANLLVRDGRVTAANTAAASLLGLEADAIVGRSIRELGLVAIPPSAEAEPWETELRLGEDRAVPIAVTVTSVQRDDGPLQHWVWRDLSVVRDAEAERRQLESQVREAQKLESLGTLAGGVAHDFNNLLGVIRGNAELARESITDPDEVADHLAAVLDASERARDLVRQILTFSRRTAPHEAVVDLGAVARSLVPMLRSLIPRSVETVLVGGDAVYPVRGDLTQLQQLLFNLCSNAEYAMRPTNGGRLEMRLESVVAPAGLASPIGRAVVLRVSDTGVGMPADVRDRVFEPFFTTKPTGEGTGLGLSVLHGIVASHGGRVSVESTPGVGTTFEVVLPMQRAELAIVAGGGAGATPLGDGRASGPREVEPLSAHEPVRAAEGDASVSAASADPLVGARVVLVDDEPAVSRVMERALTRLGCRIRTFNDPREALRYLSQAEQEVDLLLTDQTMPGLTGDDLAAAVHRERPELPVVIVSGYSYRLTPERLSEVGAAAVLQKPVPVEQLAQTVRSVLRDRTPNPSLAR